MMKKSIQTDVILSAPKKHLKTLNIVFLVFIFILAIIFVHEASFYNFYRFSTIIILIFLSASLLYELIQNKTFSKKNGLLWIFIIIAIIPNYIYPYHYGLKFVNLIFVNVLMAYWFMSCAKHLIVNETSDWIILDLLYAVFHSPFVLFHRVTDYIKQNILGNVNKNIFIKIFIGFMISVPLLMIIVTLLSRADQTFKYYVSHIEIKWLIEWVITILLAIPIFYYYSAMSFGHLTTKADKMYHEEKIAKKINQLSFIPQGIFTTMECILVFTYLLFLIASMQSLIANIGISKNLFSYASFARQGFFELCIISFLNLAILLGVRLIAKGKNKFSYGVEKILIIETLFIIMNAMSKMIMYIQVYEAFTYLRIYASWFMFVLFGIFLLLLIQKRNAKSKVVSIVYFVCLSFLCLNLCNVSYWASDSSIDTLPMYENKTDLQ